MKNLVFMGSKSGETVRWEFDYRGEKRLLDIRVFTQPESGTNVLYGLTFNYHRK